MHTLSEQHESTMVSTFTEHNSVTLRLREKCIADSRAAALYAGFDPNSCKAAPIDWGSCCSLQEVLTKADAYT